MLLVTSDPHTRVNTGYIFDQRAVTPLVRMMTGLQTAKKELRGKIRNVLQQVPAESITNQCQRPGRRTEPAI